MKKILSAVAALGLVAGVASTAAAVEFSATGRYVVEGYYLSDAAGDGLQPSQAAGTDPGSDAYFLHTLKIAPVLKVNDKVKVVTDFWLADNNFWGNQDDVQGTAQGRALAGDTTNDVEVWQAYIDYASPVGGLKIGRMLSGPFGTSFLDSINHADRIIWSPSMLASGPWSTILKYEKTTENDGMIAGASAAATDQDNDYYEVDLFHKTDKGLGFSRIAYRDNQATAGTDTQQYGITVGGNYKLPALYIQTEIDYRFGDSETDAGVKTDFDGLAGFLQVGKNLGALDVSGMYFYAEGDDNAADDNERSAIAGGFPFTGLGNEFEPYYIMTGSHAGIFNTELYGTTAGDIRGIARTAGIHSLGVHANYAMSEKLMLHGAVAYHMAADELATYDDEFGIEYNVGAAYKLLDNMTYEVHFGFLDAGDFFKGANGTAFEEESVYLASNHLTMTF